MVVLSVSGLVLGTQGVPLGLQTGDTLRLDSDEEGWRVRNLAYVEGSLLLKEGIIHIYKLPPTTSRCEKLLLYFISSKIFDLKCPSTSLNQDHEKYCLKHTNFVCFHCKKSEMSILIERVIE